jgi:hypothetical protein
VSKVISLDGGPIGLPERNENAVATLREALEMAEAGEIVGIGVVMLHKDAMGSYRFGGKVGGYSMLGAIDVMKADLMEVVRGE